MGDEEEGMKTTLTLCVITLLAVLSGCGGPGANAEIPQAEAAGETSKDIGDFVVHFSALSTEQIPPDIAKTYDIVRSKNRAMLNVSVIRKADDTAVPGCARRQDRQPYRSTQERHDASYQRAGRDLLHRGNRRRQSRNADLYDRRYAGRRSGAV
jgi:hypothetical protein